MNRQGKTLVTVFLLALVVRFAALALLLPQFKPDVDLDWYRSLGRNLASGKGFVAQSANGQELPQVDRTPVYPLFLAAIIRLGGDRLGLFLAVQCVVGALTCALTTLLAMRWLSTGWSMLAGLLITFDPNSIARCVDLRTETVFTALIVAGACLLAWRTEAWWPWFLAGLTGSAASLCRPIAIGLWVAAVLVGVAWRVRWTCMGAFMVGFLLLIGPWMARNAALTGHWFFSTASTYNLYVVRASGVAAEKEGISHNAMQDRFAQHYREVQFFVDRLTFERALRECRVAAREIVLGSPMIAARQYVQGWLQLLFGPGPHSLDNSLINPKPPSRWWPPIYGLTLAFVTIAGILGTVRLGRKAVLVPALVLYFVALSGGGGANSRFRAPIMPSLVILAAAGIESIKNDREVGMSTEDCRNLAEEP